MKELKDFFIRALDTEALVVAHVKLYNGQSRTRVGYVANVNDTHVTIFDLGKGFRTTPLDLVNKVEADIQEGVTA